MQRRSQGTGGVKRPHVNRRRFVANSTLGIVGIVASNLSQQPEVEYDIVVYGGTSAGIAAALQAARLGRSVILIEPTARLGGLTTGGLGQTDIGNKRAIGGIARQFYQRIQRHYAQPEAWEWQKQETYRDGGQTRTGPNEDAMWTFEPSAALKVYEAMARESKLSVVRGERLDRKNGVQKRGPQIVRISMESGRRFRGRVFIDATYEGDLMAAAKVSYTVGREANRVYGETLNGVQIRKSVEHQLKPQVDPFVRKSDASSGLLPGIDPAGPGIEGEGDHRVQAYCFRLCLTDHPDNRLPIEKPEGYRELDYELMFRNFEAGETEIPWIHSLMPNRKTDINNRNGFSSDFIGQNYRYPDGDYATRQKIIEQHRLYQQGLMFTLAHHPRVPEHIRQEVGRWGLCKDEFVEGNGWQEQLYVREARRLVGSYVMIQHNCLGHDKVPDSVGLAAYTMDSHNVQRHVTQEGYARNEGNIEVGGFPPYPISYRALTPRRNECTNLLVPVCLSTSHIAFGSIRMEPVFMVLAQSAATAAHQAIGGGLAVQDVDYSNLRKRLLSDGQILEWSEEPKIARAGI